MKVIITGANGFIGSYMMSHFSKNGHDTIGIVRTEKRELRENIIVRDISKPLDVGIYADAIIHAAAVNPRKNRKMDEYVVGNIIGTKNIIDFAKNNGISKIIYLAAVSSYGNVSGELREDTPHKGTDSYGISKLVAEKLIRESGINNRILILPGVIGKECNSNWLINTAISLYKNEKIDVYNPKGLFNNVVEIEDICDFVATLVKGKMEGSETYIMGTEEKIRVEQLISNLCKRIKSKSMVNFIEGTDGFYINCSKALIDGYHSKSISDILDEVVEEAKVRSIK